MHQEQQIDERSLSVQSSSAEYRVEVIKLTCQLCYQFLCSATETICNHVFCELCLNEYLLYLSQCPQCGTRIRGYVIYSNKLVDSIILDLITRSDKQKLTKFNQRLEKHYSFKRSSTIDKGKIAQGLQIDVLDKNYVWCTGKIVKIINDDQDLQIDKIVVKYGRLKNKQEIQFPTSRIAVKGTYTDRKQIPHYQRNKVVYQDNHQIIEMVDWECSSSQDDNGSNSRK